jgi:3-hydroxy-3-methylglutaryl CoA synthase
MKMYRLSEAMLEGYDLGDYVYNYYHNPEAKMPKIILDMVLFCAEIKRKINNKDISFTKGYKQVCDMFGNFLGVVLDNELNPDEKDFFNELLSYIPDHDL